MAAEMTNDEIKKYRALQEACPKAWLVSQFHESGRSWRIVLTKKFGDGLSELECDALRDYLVAAYKGFPNALDEIERLQSDLYVIQQSYSTEEAANKAVK